MTDLFKELELEELAKLNKNNFKIFEDLSSDPNDYLMIDCIGKGNFGEVFKAIYLPYVNQQSFPNDYLEKLAKYEYDEAILKFLNFLEDNYFVAIKIIDLEDNDDDIDVLCQEIQFLTTLQSETNERQNIVKYYKTFIYDQKMWIVMEYCGGSSVYDLIKNLPMHISEKVKMEHLSEAQISNIVLEVVMGLLALHEKGSIHRDIKLANILLTKDGQIKLSDFGVSGTLNNTLKKRETFVGTPYWMAPEVILNGYTDLKTGIRKKGYNEKADIWSLGITIMELVNKKPPLIEHEPGQIVSKIPDLDPPTLKNNESWKCSKHLVSFVDACLKKNPDERMSAKQLTQLKFIKKHINSNHNLIFAVEHIRDLKLKKSLLKLNKGYNGLMIWSKKPRYYRIGNRKNELYQSFDKTADDNNRIAWSFTVTNKTPNLTKRLTSKASYSAKLIKNSAENYTPASMKTPTVKGEISKNTIQKKKQATEGSDDEIADEDMNSISEIKNVSPFSEKVHVYNEVILPVFSDLIKRSMYPETQAAVVQLLKKFHETEKSQPGFSNVFIEEIAYKLNELELHI